MTIIRQNDQAIVVQSEVFITNLNGAQIVLTAMITLLCCLFGRYYPAPAAGSFKIPTRFGH